MKDILSEANKLSTAEKGEFLCGLLNGMDSKGVRGVQAKAEESFGVKIPEPFVPPVFEQVVEEEPTELDVFIESCGQKKIHVIKAVRELSGLVIITADESRRPMT